MSRNILQNHKTNVEAVFKQTADGKLIITKDKERELALLIKNNRLLDILPLQNTSQIGAIYVGKVKNVVKNLNACFVEVADNELCFLPFDEAKHPFLMNRTFDGRILQGDELLVQIIRDAQKTKLSAVTCHISLQSDYFVFSVGNTKLGISSKLSAEQKSNINRLLKMHAITDAQGFLEQTPTLPAYGCVVRTRSIELLEKNPDILLDNFQKQKQAFIQLFETARHRTCFTCIQAPKKPYETILSYFNHMEYKEVLTDLPEAYTSLQGHADNLRLYQDETFSLMKLYDLENKIQNALSNKVWLKSGAYLVIEQTECLTTIDVNSGKMIKGTQNKESIQKINEEAAREAAIQIRLRNISGIIIIDFINMHDKETEEQLIALMKELTASDNVLVNVVDITPLGLMELTRKKLRASLKEQLQSNN